MTPIELRVSKDRRTLAMAWPDGARHTLEAELLRVMSPSAEVQGHSPDQKVTISGKRDVAIMQMVPTGNYAVRIVFDDMHDTGIFTWRYLRELGDGRDTHWRNYEAELAQKGLSREPRRPARQHL